MLPRLRILIAAAGLTVVTVLAGVVLGSGPDPSGPEAGTGGTAPSPSAAPDVTGLEVRRAAFCTAVPEEAVTTALGEVVASSESYDSGEEARLGGGLTDVAHEFGCTWRSRQASAQAWVFAPPVDRDRATELIDGVTAGDRCRRVDGPAFGSPGVALHCDRGARAEVSFRGLFGDAWLTCTLVPSASQLRADGTEAAVDRAGRWCAGVAAAAAEAGEPSETADPAEDPAEDAAEESGAG